MHRLFAALAVLLLLCACVRAEAPEPDAAMPVVVPAQEPVSSLPAEEEPFTLVLSQPPVWDGSDPQQGEPVTPQPGDTAATWDIRRAADFPADDDCMSIQLLQKWLETEGLTFADLEARGCTQLVLVCANEGDGASARITCYAFEDNAWQAVPGLWGLEGYVGSNGIAHDRKRNTLQSPAGLWALGSAFGLAEKPENLRLAWRDITPDSDWVCDADSPYFNTWQERDDPAVTLWNIRDVEHLADFDPTYRYACVIEYNTPPYTVPERGCAIFLHCSDHPTSGCVGLLEEDMRSVLLWLDPRESPHILITGWAISDNTANSD